MSEILSNDLLLKIQGGENISVEFKRAYDQLPDSLFESICAMLNRNGGHIFLGVRDDGYICGVDPEKVVKLKKDFSNLCNNSQKIFPTIHMEIKEYTVNDKVVLYIYVYEGSDVHFTANKIFDRNEDGDYDITGNTQLISQMYIRKSSTYIENKIYPYAKLENLRSDLIDRARRLASNRVANHPWRQMDDIELLRSAGLYEKDFQTGLEGINLAGILLLGRDETIASALSYYRTDAILRINDKDRYDDRDDIRTNLLDSYDRLISFLEKHVDERFYLEDGRRIDIRGIVARELCTNLLIHREYSNPVPAQLLITDDKIEALNPSKPRFVGYIDFNDFSPFPKNPKIASFFKEIGYADELGSGIRKIAKYAEFYSKTNPSFHEGEMFDAVFYLRDNMPADRVDIRKEILAYIKSNSGVARKDINEFIYPILRGYSDKQKNLKVQNVMAGLSRSGTIKNMGSNKKPSWVYCGDE